MPDNLTTRIQEELARRGKVVSQDQIRSILAKKNESIAPTPVAGQNKQLEALSKISGLPGAKALNAQQVEIDNTALNAVGATLWSFANTAAFGIPGAFVTEEDYLNFEDPYAKWGGAIGGFSGFVFGAPMRVGAKAVSTIAKPFIKGVGKKSVDTIVRGVKNSSHVGGVDKKVISEITGGYKSLALSAQKNPALRGEAFKTKSVDYITNFLRKAEANGDITAQQAQGILKAFGDDFMKRPLQDFMGVVQASGVLANSPRAMRVLGHSINDALMFGMIDTVFEGFSTFEDHEFDWTAPLWGVGTGAMFGQLSWMNPRGKGATWWRDWKKGIQASFAKNPYEGKSMEELVTRAKLMAESSGKNRVTSSKKGAEPPRGTYRRKTITGKEVELNAEPKIEWKGKEYEIDFNRKDLGKWLSNKFGDDAADVLRKALDKERVGWGREIRHWANRESMENVQEAWFRMAAGGILFNAHTFYDMYAHGYDAEMSDILPHFLIGAYVQRYSNPAKFDINSRQINRVRENLMILDFSPDQLRSIPSFDYIGSRLNDPLTAEKYSSIRDMAKEMNLVGDKADDVNIKLEPGQISIEMRPNEWFNRIYEYLKRSGKVPRDKDQISVEEAEAIVKEFKRLEPSVKTLKDLEILFDEAYLAKTQDFEDTLYQLLDTIRKSDELRELGIHLDQGNRKNNRVPDYIDISEELIKKAKDGELDWILDKNNPDRDLKDTIEGFLSVMQTLSLAQVTKSIPDGKTRVIESEELLKRVYEETKASEAVVESEFPNRNFVADKFSYKHDAPEYLDAITRNTAIQISEKVYSIFKKNYPEYGELSALLTDVGLLSGKETIGEIRERAALIKNTSQIKVTGTKEGTDEAAELKGFLGRILSISAASGTYGRQQGKPKYIEVSARKIKKLKKFMEKRSYDVTVMKNWMHEHMVNYILRDRIKRTDLRVDQVEALFNLSELGFANLSFAVKGEATGFSIRLVDEVVIPSSENAGKMGQIAREYNRYAKKIIKDSNGLVREDADLIKVLDAHTMLDIDLALPKTNGGISARGKLLEVMNALPGKYGPTVRQMGLYMQEGGTNRLTKWLIQAGVIEPKKKQSSKYSVNEESLKKFNDEFAATLKDRMDTYGSSQKMAEEQYNRDVKFARDQIYRDLDEIGYDRHITLQEFFQLYRIDGLDMEGFSAEERSRAWDDLVYESKDKRLLHDGVLDQVLDRIHVEKGTAKDVYKTEKVEIYDVLVDMFEDPKAKDRANKDRQDIWIVDRLADAEAQLAAIKAGHGGGTNFADTIVRKGNRYILTHKYGDDKHIYIRGTEPKGLIKDTEGRVKGDVYIKDVTTKVKAGVKKYKPFRELSDKEQKHRRKDVLYNLTGLFATQRAQIKIPVIKYQNGDIKEGYEFQQATRHTDFLQRDLNMPFYIVDNMAAVYEMVDGRYTRLVLVDVFGDSTNLTKEQNKVIRQHKNVFKNLLSVRERLFGNSIRGEGDETGVQVMRLLPNMPPIAIEARNLINVEKPFIEFAKLWGRSPSLTEGVRKNINRIRESFERGEGVSDERQYALRTLTLHNWLNSSHKGLGGGGKKFIEILNTEAKDIGKQLGRAKLYDTKRFVRNDLPFVIDIARAYESIGDKETYRVFRKFANKKGFGVAIWNDAEFARVKDQIADQLKKQGITTWDYENVIGDAHAETSAFDSIAFVTKDVMRYGHTSVGHNPNSLNPFKPIISSTGTSSLLMGKTLFVYSPDLDGFFKANPTTDILMTKTGSKLFNEAGKAGERDPSIINEPYTELVGKRPLSYAAGDKVRFISLESLGILPSKDSVTSTAPRAQSDYNFMSNSESAIVWEGEYRAEVEGGIARVENVLSSPWVMNEWVRRQIGTSNLIADPAANIGSAQYSNLVYFAGLGRDMNPMSHSPRKMKNQLFDIYLNSVMNRMRSTSRGEDQDNGQRYGGQSTLIQSPRVDHRLNSTLVDRNGNMLALGEVLLPAHESRMRLDELTSDGRDLRFVRGSEIFTAEEIFKLFTNGNAEDARELWKAYKDYADLGTLQEMLQQHIELGDIPEGTQVGIIVNRKPRTRPNDMTIVGLKGFLDREYGNSVSLGSLDVANIFEGDYDADKIDYFMASKSGLYDHVERSSKFFVQGIDPSNLRSESKFTFGGKISDVNRGIEDMAANNDLFNRNIGVVQKIPRKLGYAEKLSYMDLDDPFVRDFVRTGDDGERTGPRILFETKDGRGNAKSKILFDYNNLDFFTRAALETQYIIDGDGRINNQISSDITSWHDRFLFPSMAQSMAPGDVVTGKMGFINDLRDKGHSLIGGQKKRVRIFRKVKFEPLTNEFREVELNNAEKAVIKTLLSEYGKVLNAAGKKMFEKSGTQRSINYDDVMEASQRFFDFHYDISESLFKTLKNRKMDPSKKDSKKWVYDEEFMDLFGVVKSDFYSKKDRKKVEYWKSSKRIVDTTLNNRAKEINNGERGAPLDRILYQIKEADLFEDIKTKTVTGDIVRVMDDWYRSMISGDEYASEIAASRIRKGVIASAGKINKSVDIIINLKKKLWAVKNNDKIPYAARKKIIADMNKEIKLNEKAISKFIPMQYWKTKKGADLKRMQFVAVDEREVKEGAIQYATMRNIRRILPLIGDSPNWGLGPKALKDLKEIKTLRQFFYSNRDNLADVLQYGDKTLLSEEKRNYLKNTPDLSSFNEVEGKLLMDGYQKYGPSFIYAFMAPVADNYKIGVFEGEPLPVPYAATTRYSKGLQFLTNIAKETDMMSATMRDMIDQPFNLSRDALMLHQTIEKGFNDFFNRKTAMKEIRYEYKQIISKNGFDLPDQNPFEGLSFKQIRLPNFSKDFERMFTSYRDIKWSRDTKRTTTGFEMMNDHLIDFYADIMKLAGKEAEFESYLNSMNDLTSKMIENQIIDPIEYMAIRSTMDREVRRIARDVITGEIMQDRDNVSVKNLLKNPVYALMGGPSFFKGLSLEKTAKYKPSRLKSLRRMYDNLEAYDHKLQITSKNDKDRVRKIREACFGGA